MKLGAETPGGVLGQLTKGARKMKIKEILKAYNEHRVYLKHHKEAERIIAKLQGRRNYDNWITEAVFRKICLNNIFYNANRNYLYSKNGENLC